MAAKDIYHEHVRVALEKDGWTITHDPLPLKGNWDSIFDPSEEHLLGAEKGARKIAVAVCGFLGPSDMHDWYSALGRAILCRHLLEDIAPERQIYLAIRETVYLRLAESVGRRRFFLEKEKLNLIVFDHREREVLLWIP